MRCRPARREALEVTFARALLGMVLGAAIWVTASSCTVLSDFDIEQCTEDSECPIVGGQARICEGERCVAGCRDNRHCQEANQAGGDAICPARGAECVSLASDECFRAYAKPEAWQAVLDRRGDELAVLALFAPDVSSETPSPSEITYRVAIDALNDVGGLPAPPGERSMPVVGLLCDDDPSAVGAAMTHVTEKLGVRSVLAALEPDALRIAVEGRDPGVFFLSPFWDPGSTVARSDALWYLLGEQTSIAPAYAPLLRRVQALIERQRGVSAAEQRIAFVYSEAPGADLDRRLMQAVEHALGYEGEAGLELERTGRSRHFGFDDDAGDLDGVAQALAGDYRPHVVLWFASGNLASEIPRERSSGVAAIEAAWPPAEARPYYVLAPGNVEDDAITDLGADASFRARALGLNVHRPLQLDLAGDLNTAYDGQVDEDTRIAASPNLYDGVYLLAYAAAARRWLARSNAGDASMLAGFLAVTDLSSGRHVQVGGGSEGHELGFEFLRRTESFALHGVTGPPDFDPTTRARPIGATPYCLIPREEGGVERVFWSIDQWVYDAVAAAGEGDFVWRGQQKTPYFCFDGLLP